MGRGCGCCCIPMFDVWHQLRVKNYSNFAMIAIKQNLQLLTNRCSFIRLTTATSVTSKKLPNVNKSCQKTISLEN